MSKIFIYFIAILVIICALYLITGIVICYWHFIKDFPLIGTAFLAFVTWAFNLKDIRKWGK